MNKNIEVEGGEIAIRNSHGDLAIIPKDKKDWVKQKLSEGCHSCIDSLVETLPVMEDYAQDGSLFPNGEEVEVYNGKDPKYDVKSIARRNGTTQLSYEKEPSTHRMSYAEVNGKYVVFPTLFQDKDKWVDLDATHNKVDKWAALDEAKRRGETFSFDDEKSASDFAAGSWKKNYTKYNTSSQEYRDLYNSGRLTTYDKETDTYSATPLKEVTITAEAPQWLKYKREYEKTNPKSNYINNYLTPFARSLGNTETNYPKRLDEEYEQKSLDYVSEQLVKNKPQGKLSRVEWLNQMSDKEEELIKRNPKYQSSLWADTKRGLTSLVEQNPLQTFQNILNSSDYTNREKQEMLKDYNNHPVMSKLGDATKILNPLTVPSKMVQSSYKDDYSFSDALKGKKNNAGIVEDIVTDPLNLIGAGLVGKLSKADKVIDATKAGSKVLSKTDDVVKNASLIPNWTVSKIKSVEEIDKLDNLHPVFKIFDKDTWKEIAQKKGNEYFLDRFNKQLVNVTNDLNSYENLAINISDYPEIIEGKKWSEDFVKSSEWKQRVKNANPDLTEEQINNLQKSTLLSMPSNMKTFIKNQASKNSFHGGQFTYDDLVHGRNVAFRYFTPEEVLENPLHFKSLASHEFGHSQSSMRKLPNDKSWHQPLEESGDMMKTNNIYRGDRYVELSEEKRARSIPSYMFAKENNLLENGEFTEKTYDVLKNMAEKDWKSVPNDFNSILSWYDKKSAINYLNKFYATIPFYLYLQSQNQNKSEQ